MQDHFGTRSMRQQGVSGLTPSVLGSAWGCILNFAYKRFISPVPPLSCLDEEDVSWGNPCLDWSGEEGDTQEGRLPPAPRSGRAAETFTSSMLQCG